MSRTSLLNRSANVQDFEASNYRRANFTPVCWYDASRLTGANGSAVRFVPDRAGRSNDLVGASGTSPTLVTNALNGKSVLNFAVGAGQFLSSSPSSTWQQPAQAQPIALVAVVKFSSSSAIVVGQRGVIGTTGAILGIAAASTNVLYAYAGAALFLSGQSLADDTWHIIVVSLTPQGGSMYLDGVLVGVAESTTPFGTGGATTSVTLGKTGQNLDGQIAEAGILSGYLTHKDIADITASLSAKWGIACPATPGNVTIHDITDANGQAVRLYYSPDKLNGVAHPPLVIWNHQVSSAQLYGPTFVGSPIYYTIHDLARAGYVVAAPNNHGLSNWSQASSVADGPAAETAAAGVIGVSSFSRIVLVGMSMGGGLATVQAKRATFSAPLKGVYTIDGAVSLWGAYNHTSQAYRPSIDTAFSINAGTLSAASSVGATSVSSSVSFASGTKIVIGAGTANAETVTTTGAPTGAGPYAIPVPALANTHASAAPISDYPTKTSGYDAGAWLGTDVPSGLRWRLMASPNDASAIKAQQADVLVGILNTASPAPVEVSTVAHADGHLGVGAFYPADVISFVNRCI